MKKFFAVIKREYLYRVRSRFFVVATVMGPVMLALFAVVPVYIAQRNFGGATRLAVVDQSGKVYERFREALSETVDEDDNEDENEDTTAEPGNTNREDQFQRSSKLSHAQFAVELVSSDGRSLEEVKRQLSERVRQNELDGYVVIPADILADGKAEFYGRNTGDIFTRGTVASRLSRAVREQRLAENKIDQRVLHDAGRRVSLSSTKISSRGEERVSNSGFTFVFSFGLLIYVSVMLYGQLVLSAVLEEKETRIAEILFSSVRSFPLMMGKLVGVSLVALTQLSIWGLAFLFLAAFGAGMAAAQGVPLNIPHIAPMMFVYFVLFFLLGYFIYATIYALIGSMVTTTQEGGQMAMPVVLMLVAGFYFVFPIIRSPNSPLAFWASMFPFLAPITMMVRITTETPPAWQIILSLSIGFATVVGLVWVASRIYRVGMLMYGKKATIPEVWRWVRQA
jgi:ABC-2 type transport system permease protein